MSDPVISDPELYRVVFENERVRVLEYRDTPGAETQLHAHPDSVMVPLTSFSRVIASGAHEVAVEVNAGQIRWLGGPATPRAECRRNQFTRCSSSSRSQALRSCPTSRGSARPRLRDLGLIALWAR